MTRDPAALVSRPFDVIVVGGGICGAAIAWDAAHRGLSVALLERDDFGGATSANSLKIVHGGIRYLQHLDVARVRQSSGERRALLRIAPHLVHPLPVVVPTVGHGRQGRELLAAAFATLNALTADRNTGLDDPARRIPRARLIGREEALVRCPGFEGALDDAGLFWDGQVDNPPRLVWAFIRSAVQAGGVAVNHCEVTGLLRHGNRVFGVAAEDRLTGDRFQVRGQLVVNAAGPFADQLAVDTGLRAARSVPLSRDMALVLRPALLRDTALAIQTVHRDPDAWLSRGQRHLFVVPWHGVTLVGVHSIVYPGNPYALRTSAAEVETFLGEIAEAMPWWAPREADVAAVYAGLLPIGDATLRRANVSFGKRAHLADNARTDGVEGLVTVVANRLTTARSVAEQVVDLAFRKRARRPPPCRTAGTPLYGGHLPDITAHISRVVRELAGRAAPVAAERLARNHGASWKEPIGLAPPGALPTIAGSTTLAVEVVHAVRREMARTLADCVLRRTDLGTAGHPGDEALADCAGIMAGELGWSPERVASELGDVRARLSALPPSPGVMARSG